MSTPSPLIPLTGPRERGRRRPRALGAVQRPVAAARPAEQTIGRAWINSSEVGGTDARFAHLSEAYD